MTGIVVQGHKFALKYVDGNVELQHSHYEW